LKDLIEVKLIESSDGRIGAPLLFFLDKKGNQKTLQLVCNYRHLNNCLEDDVYYPLPNNEEDNYLSNFTGARYFSFIDAASGYWQIRKILKAKRVTAVMEHCRRLIIPACLLV